MATPQAGFWFLSHVRTSLRLLLILQHREARGSVSLDNQTRTKKTTRTHCLLTQSIHSTKWRRTAKRQRRDIILQRKPWMTRKTKKEEEQTLRNKCDKYRNHCYALVMTVWPTRRRNRYESAREWPGKLDARHEPEPSRCTVEAWQSYGGRCLKRPRDPTSCPWHSLTDPREDSGVWICALMWCHIWSTWEWSLCLLHQAGYPFLRGDISPLHGRVFRTGVAMSWLTLLPLSSLLRLTRDTCSHWLSKSHGVKARYS